MVIGNLFEVVLERPLPIRVSTLNFTEPASRAARPLNRSDRFSLSSRSMAPCPLFLDRMHRDPEIRP